MKTIETISKIINEQVELYKKRSSDTRLAVEEIEVLKILTEMALKVNEASKSKRKRNYTSGAKLSNDELIEYAKK